MTASHGATAGSPNGSSARPWPAADQFDIDPRLGGASYDLMFNQCRQCRPAETIERYVGDVYIQHNPSVADGKDAFTEYFTHLAGAIPARTTLAL
jgi:predicted SnoaL-like aldol condensation-catalyzing enzyme